MMQVDYAELKKDITKTLLNHVDYCLINATPELKKELAKDNVSSLNISKDYLNLFLMRDESISRLGLITRLLGTLVEQAIDYLKENNDDQ